jgi:threonine/homoserine/homoserine lactone efflux protein
MTQLTRHPQAKNAIVAILQLIGAALLIFCALSTPTFANDSPGVRQMPRPKRSVEAMPDVFYYANGISKWKANKLPLVTN